jgi:hypothetical protein
MIEFIHLTTKNVSIMACAGYGKSYIIHKLLELNPNKYIVTSTMSGSAKAINGVTIHSLLAEIKKLMKNKIVLPVE